MQFDFTSHCHFGVNAERKLASHKIYTQVTIVSYPRYTYIVALFEHWSLIINNTYVNIRIAGFNNKTYTVNIIHVLARLVSLH